MTLAVPALGAGSSFPARLIADAQAAAGAAWNPAPRSMADIGPTPP